MVNCHMIVCWTDMKYVQPSYLCKLRYLKLSWSAILLLFLNKWNFIFINFLIFAKKKKKAAIDFFLSAISLGSRSQITYRQLACQRQLGCFCTTSAVKECFPPWARGKHNRLSQKRRALVSKVSLIWISNLLKVQLTWHRCLVVT